MESEADEGLVMDEVDDVRNVMPDSSVSCGGRQATVLASPWTILFDHPSGAFAWLLRATGCMEMNGVMV